MVEDQKIYEIVVDDATVLKFEMTEKLNGYQYGLGAGVASKLPIKAMTETIYDSTTDDEKMGDREKARRWEVSKAKVAELMNSALVDDPKLLCKIGAIVMKPVGKEWHDEQYDEQIKVMQKASLDVLNAALVFFLESDENTPNALVSYLKQVLVTNTKSDSKE